MSETQKKHFLNWIVHQYMSSECRIHIGHMDTPLKRRAS